jgi:cyclophilin family peptidyl-prolyl cis-trans isomerase
MRYLILISFLFASCKPNWRIDPAKVKQELQAQSAQHTERRIQVSTRLGDFELELDDRTPLHTVNFIRLVKMGYFEDRYFYRNVYEIGIQGGGEYFDRLNYLVPAEYVEELRPVRGTIAMARYDEGNPLQSSSPTEFFIVTDTEQASRFYRKYVVFGKVTKGMAVVDSIKKERSFDEKPVIPVKFSMSVLDQK